MLRDFWRVFNEYLVTGGWLKRYRFIEGLTRNLFKTKCYHFFIRLYDSPFTNCDLYVNVSTLTYTLPNFAVANVSIPHEKPYFLFFFFFSFCFVFFVVVVVVAVVVVFWDLEFERLRSSFKGNQYNVFAFPEVKNIDKDHFKKCYHNSFNKVNHWLTLLNLLAQYLAIYSSWLYLLGLMCR